MYVLSQIFVIISNLLCIVSMLNKRKKYIILFLILSTIFFALQYICLKAWTGAVIALIELIFLIGLNLLEKFDKTKYNLYLSIGTIIITIILSIITWNTWISLIPMLSMIIYLISMMFANVVIVKSGTFIRLILNGIYMLLIKSYLGAGLTIVILIFTIIGIVNDVKNKKVSIKYQES